MKTIAEQLEKKISIKMENKYMPLFEKQASFIGNGIYRIIGTNLYSTDTRELFLMFIAARENIKYISE